MKNNLALQNGIVIPEHELEFSASRAGGPGGQHVNKTSTKITVRFNIKKSSVLSEVQKERLLKKLRSEITQEGEILVHNGSIRSQLQNKKLALDTLALKLNSALLKPKKRMKTKIPKAIKESRIKKKKQRSEIKKMRSKKWD